MVSHLLEKMGVHCQELLVEWADAWESGCLSLLSRQLAKWKGKSGMPVGL